MINEENTSDITQSLRNALKQDENIMIIGTERTTTEDIYRFLHPEELLDKKKLNLPIEIVKQIVELTLICDQIQIKDSEGDLVCRKLIRMGHQLNKLIENDVNNVNNVEMALDVFRTLADLLHKMIQEYFKNKNLEYPVLDLKKYDYNS